MSTDDDKLLTWAAGLGVNAEMVCRIVGDQPLVLGVNSQLGYIYLGIITDRDIATLVEWTAVQGEELQVAHERALNVLASGVGSLH